MKKAPVIVFLSILFLSGVVFAQEAEKVKLEYNFKVGSKFNYKMNIDGDVTVGITQPDGQKLPQNKAKLRGEFLYEQQIISVDPRDKSASISVIYGPCYMDTIIGESTIPNADVPALEGKKAMIIVTRTGEVKEYKMPEALPSSLKNADFKKMFVTFPDHTMRVGESWIRDDSQDQKTANASVKSVTHSKYTFLGREKKSGYECAKVKFESKTDTQTKTDRGLADLDGEVKGSVDGLIYYDLDTGYIAYSDLETKIDNKIETEQKQPESKEKEAARTNGKMITHVNTYLHTITQLF